MGMILALFILVGLDLGVKWYVEHRFGEKEERSYLNGKVKMLRFHNPGFVLGKVQERPDVVKYGSLAVMILVGLQWLFLLPVRGKHLLKAAVTCLFAGAISNVSDRLVRGYVVDYLSVKTKWEKINRLVFNLGDILILIGSIGVLITSLITSGKHK